MFVTVKINEELPRGTLVCHDDNNVWRKATSTDVAPFGVIRDETFLDDSLVRWAVIILSGSCWARAGSNIPSKGGWLGCDDEGRAIVTSSEECGLIAPLSRGMSLPLTDQLILVHLR